MNKHSSTPVTTNYDRIVAMNPDELAFDLAQGGCPIDKSICPAEEDPERYHDCVKCWLDWLKSPVEEEQT